VGNLSGKGFAYGEHQLDASGLTTQVEPATGAPVHGGGGGMGAVLMLVAVPIRTTQATGYGEASATSNSTPSQLEKR
jgi:hypothetical protein